MPVDRPIRASNPDVSVVIPTLPDRDVDSLPGLRDQTLEDYEVIVVRDADLDRSAARNLGIRQAAADVIALTDDDTDPPEHWLSVARNRLTSGAVLLEGPIRYRTDAGTEFEDTFRNYMSCNLAVRREAWAAVDGFDSRYAGWGEDNAFGWSVEREFGVDACEYSRQFTMTHLGRGRSNEDVEKDIMLRRSFPEEYFRFRRKTSSWAGSISAGVLRFLHDISPGVADTCHPYLTGSANIPYLTDDGT
jgi:GT2 family glycosyltransferase